MGHLRFLDYTENLNAYKHLMKILEGKLDYGETIFAGAQ